MIKQRTSNSFQGGMIQDINPLNADQTSLYNCLNGTFISNDGDEMILQNDMGNARVFQIRLDSGYVPVGMCEHGGVTYIASYNPLTNKSQVGSFPSPQESYFSQSWGEDSAMSQPCGTLGNGRLEFIQQLFPTDTVIRPGDKFDIFVSDEKYFNKKLLSNTDNVSDGKVSSPKNKAVTVSVCIADSSGNLHDITSTLKRFEINSNNEIEFNEDSLIKLNTGTIFQKYPDKNLGENGSIVDQYDVDPKNVYNHKISGNLFLVYRLNTIDSVDISAEFFKGPVDNKKNYFNLEKDPYSEDGSVDEGKLDVVFDVTYRYNSPDGYYVSEQDSTGQFNDLHGSKDDYDPEKVINGIQGEQKIDSGSNSDFKMEFDATKSDLSKPAYDYNSNLYSSRQRYLLEGIDIKGKKNIEYSLTPSTIYGDLDFFKQTIEVDLDKLNSGDVSIYQWRYFVEDSGININWGLQSYPFVGTRLTNVQLEFYNLSDPTQPEYILPIGERTSYHGNFYNYVSFDNLKQRQVYCVAISYRTTNIVNGGEVGDKFYAGYRILISTKLYNKIYSDQNILDFNKLEEYTKDDNAQYGKELYESLHTFILESTHTLKDLSDTSTVETEGSPLLLGTSTSETVTKTKTLNVEKQIVSEVNTKNSSLYPFDVRDVTYDYGKLELDKEEEEGDEAAKQLNNFVINGRYENKSSDLTNKVNTGVDSVAGDVEDGIITITGQLYSQFIGKTLSNNVISFPKALVQYFPKFSSEEESGYERDQHERLFGYSTVLDTTSKAEIKYPYYIAYGETHRGLSSHKDHHGVKYIRVDKTSGISTISAATAKDMHSEIYGDSWDYPDVYAVGDNHKKFNMVNFLKNQNFIKAYKDIQFVFFHPDSANYNSDNVEGWVGCYRKGSGGNDYKIVNKGTQDLLFWRKDNEFILVKNSSNEYLKPDTFCNLMSNIYTKSSDEVTLEGCKILSPDTNVYNEDYTVDLLYKSDISAEYTAYIPNMTSKYSEQIPAGLEELYETLTDIDDDSKKILEKYSSFIFDTGDVTSKIAVSISMEGMDETLQMSQMLSSGIFDQVVMLDDNRNLYLKDFQDNPLLLTSSYELYSGKPYLFGSKDSNNIRMKPNLSIENGQIIPYKLKSLSTIRIAHGGSGDQETTLNLGPGQKYISL